MALIRPGMGIRVGSPVAGWSPIALGASLFEWWSADGGITQSSGMVSAWQGRKAGRTLTQSTSSARPVWSATSFGGSAGLFFDGNDDSLFSMDAAGWFPTGSSPLEMWAVVQQDAPTGSDTAIRCAASIGNNSLNTDLRMRRQEQTGANRYQATVGTGSAFSTASVSGVAFSSRHVLRLAASATSYQLVLDTSPVVTTSAAKAVDAARVAIGATPPGNSQYWRGIIRHVLVTAPLTSDQAARLGAYLLKERAI